MMKSFLAVAFILAMVTNSFGITTYSGYLGRYPIELVTDISGKTVQSIYTYTKYDTPITLEGKLHEKTLTLIEKDKKGNVTATLTFPNFHEKAAVLKGSWQGKRNGKTYKITLNKMFVIGFGDKAEWSNVELLQKVSLDNYYFKVLVHKSPGDYYPRVGGVKLIEKKTDIVFQKIEFDAQSPSITSVAIDDYNFDGIKDFSVFESYYAGSNTSTLYFLFDSETGKYLDSGYEGTSLYFDQKSKTVSERNQCCAGTIFTTSVYKIVNNKMVLKEKHCYRWDEKKGEHTERAVTECD